MTIFGAPPPILFAMSGTRDYPALKDDYKRLNFLLTDKTIEEFRRLGHRDGSLEKIRFLNIRSTQAFSYDCPLRAHISKIKNNFQEINIEIVLKDQMLQLTRPLYLVDTSNEIAKMSTATMTIVRVRFLQWKDDEEIENCVAKINRFSRVKWGGTNGKMLKMGEREWKGIDGILYGEEEQIWVWEMAMRDIVQLKVGEADRVREPWSVANMLRRLCTYLGWFWGRRMSE
ncbi:hypothetical protein NHQ30_009842 [Ciborinia camelliae]|nr:hypothetical protein NHQ30_009842 [Ciborinia camelliae]